MVDLEYNVANDDGHHWLHVIPSLYQAQNQPPCVPSTSHTSATIWRLVVFRIISLETGYLVSPNHNCFTTATTTTTIPRYQLEKLNHCYIFFINMGVILVYQCIPQNLFIYLSLLSLPISLFLCSLSGCPSLVHSFVCPSLTHPFVCKLRVYEAK